MHYIPHQNGRKRTSTRGLTSRRRCGIVRAVALPTDTNSLATCTTYLTRLHSCATLPAVFAAHPGLPRRRRLPGHALQVDALRVTWFFIASPALAPSQLKRDDERTRDVFNSERRPRPHRSTQHEEFDPGSGRTLAACLMHASRTHFACEVSGARLRNTWAPAPPWGITARKRC